MATPPSGRIEKIELRECWPHEAIDFTQWLARPENMNLLAATLGVELEVQSVEHWVGDFKADIVCQRLDDGLERKVVIENQLEATDHDHLGKILTYASGLDAAMIVWVAASIRPEHLKVVEWLNEKIGKDLKIFAVEVKVWRIGSSEPAPYFNVIAKPNEWVESTKRSVRQSSELGLERRRYWEAFKASIPESFPLRMGVAREDTAIVFSRVVKGTEFKASISSDDPDLGGPGTYVVLALVGDNYERLYAELLAARTAIERELGYELKWENRTNIQRRAIYFGTGGDFRDQKGWPTQHGWFKKTLSEFHRVFTPRLQKASQDSSSLMR